MSTFVVPCGEPMSGQSMDWERLFYEPLDGANCPGVAGQAMSGQWSFYAPLDQEMLATEGFCGPKALVARVPAGAGSMLAWCVHTRSFPWRQYTVQFVFLGSVAETVFEGPQDCSSESMEAEVGACCGHGLAQVLDDSGSESMETELLAACLEDVDPFSD